MDGKQFESEFISACSEMAITQRLPSDAYCPAILWSHDSTHHLTALYCGCDDATVIRNGRDAYTICALHGLQPIGKAHRMRRNWKPVTLPNRKQAQCYDRAHFDAMLSARSQRADLVPVSESARVMEIGRSNASRLIAERYGTMTDEEFAALVQEEIDAREVIDDEYNFGRNP